MTRALIVNDKLENEPERLATLCCRDRSLSCDIGANRYLVKPVSFSGFLGIVRMIDGHWLSLDAARPEKV